MRLPVVFDEGALMAAILQHVSHMDGVTPEATATVTSLEELLAIPWVAEIRGWDGFYRFSFDGDGQRLMAEFNKGAPGYWFWVGTMSGAEELVTNLPRWHAVRR